MYPQTMVIAGALESLTQHLARGAELRHARAIAELQTGAMKNMVDALISKRSDAIEKQCHFILAMYAEQARDYMAEKKSYADAILTTRDVVRRTELMSRCHSIDAKLAEIRSDAQLVFSKMGDLLLAIGQPGLSFRQELFAPLALAHC